MRITFVSWRDLANPQAGGSEVLVDRLARDLLSRGHEVSLLAGGPTAPRPYRVLDTGGTYSQYLRAPFRFRELSRPDVVVDVENGIPFFSPLWWRGPVVCLVHHIHRDQWKLRFPSPIARAGWFLEGRVMPRAYRRAMFLAVSPSTADGLVALGIPADRIRVVVQGVDRPPRSGPPAGGESMFLALGRVVPHKRIPLLLEVWERVREKVGGRLVIAGDGPDRTLVEKLAPSGVEVLGEVSEQEKWRLLSQATCLVHTALHEGWGIVIVEAAAVATPAIGFDVPGVRDSIVHGQTGLLAATAEELAAHWVALARDPARRDELGRAAQDRAATLTWDATVEGFLRVVADAMRLAPERR